MTIEVTEPKYNRVRLPTGVLVGSFSAKVKNVGPHRTINTKFTYRPVVSGVVVGGAQNAGTDSRDYIRNEQQTAQYSKSRNLINASAFTVQAASSATGYSDPGSANSSPAYFLV